MKELIATLKIYKDAGNKEESSAEKQIGEKEFALFLRPQNDSQFMASTGVKADAEAYESVMAHELGHFISEVFHDPSHSQMYRMIFGSIEAETKAWNLAEKMIPNNPKREELKRKALQSYVENE